MQADPRFAPGWARLGRVYRLISKFYGRDVFANLDRAESAFRRALELNPDLPIAHQLYTHFEVDTGRAEAAMRRLIRRARAGTADPDLFGGLVTATRYCGLLDASIAADAHARRLDPAAKNSVSYTHWMRGEFQLALERETQTPPYMKHYALAEMGRVDEAVKGLEEMAAGLHGGASAVTAYRHALVGNEAGVREGMSRLIADGFRDPEGLFFAARALARVGAVDESLALLDQVVHGYFVPDVLERDPWLASLQSDPRMREVVRAARERHEAAAAAYREAGGPQLLGV